MDFKYTAAKLLLPISLLTLQACSSGGGDSSEHPPGTYGISGGVSGVAGEIVVDVNGTTQTIDTNGEWEALARINENESYTVSIVQNNDMSCTIDSASGTSATDVTGVNISCNGENLAAYDLKSLGFNNTNTSVITFAFHLVDRYTGSAIFDITHENVSDYLRVTENDSPISLTESDIEVDKFNNVNAKYTTVFAIDISSSISSRELANITDAIKASLIDSTTGFSTLEPNQYVTIITFDDEVETVIDEAQDPALLTDALDSIQRGDRSTNLYGAIKTGVEIWQNEISLESINYGNLILFTDGNDSSSLVSKEDALEAAEGKDIYFIATGSEIDIDVLKEFSSASKIFTLNDFDALTSTLGQAYEHIKTYEDGLYLLSYASPKRAGDHKLTVTAIDDYLCSTGVTEDENNEIANRGSLKNCADDHNFNFNADNFTDVPPELTIAGLGLSTTLSPDLTLNARIRWTTSEETPEFNWNIYVCQGELEQQLNQDGSELTLTRTSSTYAFARITLTESTHQLVTTSNVLLAPDEGSLRVAEFLNPSFICN